MADDALLPPGFEALVPFIPDWCKSRASERVAQRLSSSTEDLERFYTVGLAHAEAALTYLDTFDINALPERETRLLTLLLSLPEAGNAVEVYKQPLATAAFHPSRYPLTERD